MNTALGNNLRASGLDRSSYGLSKIASLNSDLASKGLNDFISSSLGECRVLLALMALVRRLVRTLAVATLRTGDQ